MYCVRKGLIIAVSTYHSKHFISRPVACLCVSPAARPAALRSLSSFDGGLALALPRSRFCVERRKGVCLPVWRRLKMIGFWPLWPLDALHYSIPPPPPPCPLLFISRRPRGPKHNTLGSQEAQAGKQSSTLENECRTEFNVTCWERYEQRHKVLQSLSLGALRQRSKTKTLG